VSGIRSGSGTSYASAQRDELKLLFDQNLSRKNPVRSADLYPGSTQTIEAGLDTASDLEVRRYAEKNQFIVVTRDRDFVDSDVLYGAPPKTIWIARPNLSTGDYEQLLRSLHERRSICM
jgi:predicted nuclease of predicted toxin-antitoxin system